MATPAGRTIVQIYCGTGGSPVGEAACAPAESAHVEGLALAHRGDSPQQPSISRRLGAGTGARSGWREGGGCGLRSMLTSASAGARRVGGPTLSGRFCPDAVHRFGRDFVAGPWVWTATGAPAQSGVKVRGSQRFSNSSRRPLTTPFDLPGLQTVASTANSPDGQLGAELRSVL